MLYTVLTLDRISAWTILEKSEHKERSDAESRVWEIVEESNAVNSIHKLGCGQQVSRDKIEFHENFFIAAYLTWLQK